jgi:UDP-N-acetylglucosamine--N-acetylmuramyl-(pentapeptide) pyrophosphoryl-undecaprenol N-acetylglucosamine transferase
VELKKQQKIMSQMIKLIISTGGTGGHIFPALALAEACRKKYPQADILFVGAKGKMEMEKVARLKYPIIGLPLSGFQRSFSVKNIWSNLCLPFNCFFVVGELFKFFGHTTPI